MSDTLENKSEPTKSEKEEPKTKKYEPVRVSDNVPRIDPDVSPYEEHNREAARRLGLRYSRRRGCYVDEDGCPTRDRFGQPLG
jgi:hypothetical protein